MPRFESWQGYFVMQMKLLLTSAGLTNKSLENLVSKLAKAPIKMAFIPTAANVEDGNKDWLIRNFNEFLKLGEVDVADISALPKSMVIYMQSTMIRLSWWTARR